MAALCMLLLWGITSYVLDYKLGNFRELPQTFSVTLHITDTNESAVSWALLIWTANWYNSAAQYLLAPPAILPSVIPQPMHKSWKWWKPITEHKCHPFSWWSIPSKKWPKRNLLLFLKMYFKNVFLCTTEEFCFFSLICTKGQSLNDLCRRFICLHLALNPGC